MKLCQQEQFRVQQQMGQQHSYWVTTLNLHLTNGLSTERTISRSNFFLSVTSFPIEQSLSRSSSSWESIFTLSVTKVTSSLAHGLSISKGAALSKMTLIVSYNGFFAPNFTTTSFYIWNKITFCKTAMLYDHYD